MVATTFLLVIQSPAATHKHTGDYSAPPQYQDPGVPFPRPYSRRLPPATISNTPLLTVAELEKILDELDELGIGLSGALSRDLNYESVARQSSEVHCHARRLKENLELTARHREPAGQGIAESRPVKELIQAICQTIKRLIANPALRQSNVIDADLLAKASQDLDLVIKNSKHVKQIATSLLAPDSAAFSKTRNPARKRSPYLQLSTNCWLFTPDLFLKRAASISKAPSQVIEGVKVLVKNHKLIGEETHSLDDCWVPNCSVTEYEDQHALIVKNYYTYEVDGRIFAYAALYQIARVRDGKIRERFNQPVLLYFVDEDGQGVFELLESGLPLNEIPGWVTKLRP